MKSPSSSLVRVLPLLIGAAGCSDYFGDARDPASSGSGLQVLFDAPQVTENNQAFVGSALVEGDQVYTTIIESTGGSGWSVWVVPRDSTELPESVAESPANDSPTNAPRLAADENALYWAVTESAGSPPPCVIRALPVGASASEVVAAVPPPPSTNGQCNAVGLAADSGSLFLATTGLSGNFNDVLLFGGGSGSFTGGAIVAIAPGGASTVLVTGRNFTRFLRNPVLADEQAAYWVEDTVDASQNRSGGALVAFPHGASSAREVLALTVSELPTGIAQDADNLYLATSLEADANTGGGLETLRGCAVHRLPKGGGGEAVVLSDPNLLCLGLSVDDTELFIAAMAIDERGGFSANRLARVPKGGGQADILDLNRDDLYVHDVATDDGPTLVLVEISRLIEAQKAL